MQTKLYITKSLFQLNDWKVEDADRTPTLPLTRHIDQVVLVDQALLLGGDAFAEHVVRPALVDEHDRDEDQGDD